MSTVHDWKCGRRDFVTVAPMDRSNMSGVALGQNFGTVTVIAEAGRDKRRQRYWTCRCQCGRIWDVRDDVVRHGAPHRCGKAVRRVANPVEYSTRPVRARHGLTNTLEYKCWCNIRSRCENPDAHNYARYGGRGISLCDRWQVAENFVADMGLRPGPGYSIERRDNDGNYEPSNCYWATPAQQAANRSNANRVSLNGVLIPVSRAWRALGLRSSSHLYKYAKTYRCSMQVAVDYWARQVAGADHRVPAAVATPAADGAAVEHPKRRRDDV